MIQFFLGSTAGDGVPQGSGEMVAAGSLTSEGDNLIDITAWIAAYYYNTAVLE